MSNGKLQDARNRLAWTLYPNGGEPGHTGPCCGPCQAEYEDNTGPCMDGYCCHRDTRTGPRPTDGTDQGVPAMTEQPHGEFNLAMPFVLCKSEGGPYDDAAFVAGATCGALIEELRVLRLTTATPHERYMNAKYLPQIDLIAMANGYTIKLGELDEASGWQVVAFEFVGGDRG